MQEPRVKNVHILHVVYELTVGGLELAMSRVVRELGLRGMRHSVVCLRGEAGIRDRFDDTVRIYCMSAGANDPRLPWRLRKLLCEIRPTIIHARNWGAWPDVALARLTVRPRVPLVFSFHGAESPRPMLLRRRLAFRLLAFFTTRLFTVSKASRRRLAEETGVPESRIDLIPNGVDTNRFAPAPQNREAGRFVVGSVGSLTPVKNHALLVEACAELLHGGMDLQLRIAGEGPLNAQLRQLAASLGIADRVTFCGHVEDVPQFLRALDAFVMSSDSEEHPNALLEAMACGLPCVATRVGGVPEMLQDGRAGILVNAGDRAAMAAAVRCLGNDPALRAEAGALARSRACQDYGLSRMVDAYAMLYGALTWAERDYGSSPFMAKRQANPLNK